MLLPWGETSVLGQIVQTLAASGLDEIVIVTGGARAAVEAEAERLARSLPVRTVFNPEYESGEMMSSLRAGLAALSAEIAAALIAPGDHPQLSLEAARSLVNAWRQSGARLIVPSFQRRRGHPWLVRRDAWTELAQAATARDFLNAHADEIQYVDCDESVLQDLDTPEEYERGLKNRR